MWICVRFKLRHFSFVHLQNQNSAFSNTNNVLTTFRKLSLDFLLAPVLLLYHVTSFAMLATPSDKENSPKKNSYVIRYKKGTCLKHTWPTINDCCLLRTTNCSFPVASALQLIYNSNQHHFYTYSRLLLLATSFLSCDIFVLLAIFRKYHIASFFQDANVFDMEIYSHEKYEVHFFH